MCCIFVSRWYGVGLESKWFAANVRLYEATRGVYLKINVSEPKAIIFDKKNGINNCKVNWFEKARASIWICELWIFTKIGKRVEKS